MKSEQKTKVKVTIESIQKKKPITTATLTVLKKCKNNKAADSLLTFYCSSNGANPEKEDQTEKQASAGEPLVVQMQLSWLQKYQQKPRNKVSADHTTSKGEGDK